jgi:two-component system sensor histidine kinase MprB
MKLRVESAKAEATSEEMRVQLSAADGEVDRLSAIVDRLLATAKRIETAEPREVDLHDVAERAVERWRARSRDVGAELVLEGGPARTRAEEAELDQILDNLFDNATQYAPGRIEVGTGSRDGRAWVSVRDHGAGIPLEDLPHVTERFYRGRGARAGGSGLGLAVVREVAERFGGSLSIERAEDGGTIIEVEMLAAPPLTVP